MCNTSRDLITAPSIPCTCSVCQNFPARGAASIAADPAPRQPTRGPHCPPRHVQVQIVENCGTHSMPGCDECTSTGLQCANTLRSLQTVCNAHRMEMCTQYNAMCAAAGSGLDHFCAAPAGTFDPPMRMYFHNGAAPPPHSPFPPVPGR